MPGRPSANDYAPYYETYIRLVPDGDVAEMLAQQIDESLASYRAISEEQAHFRYAPGKWTIKQVLGHVMDAERVFAYRALAIARGDTTPLPSFDQDGLHRRRHFDERPWTGLIDELKTVRAASIALFRHLSDAVQDRRGTASDNPVTPRALGFMIAGHERHHLSLLKTRYLGAAEYRR